MPRLGLALLLILLPLTLSGQAQPLSPDELATFAKYHVADIFHGKPAMPDVDDPHARMYRTRLRDAAKHGMNFAGHYAMAEWGCGTSCVEFAAINLKDGRVTFFPSAVSWTSEKNCGIRFRRDSRALHVIGDLNEEDSADRWYEWTGRSFRLLSRKPAEMETISPSGDQ